MRPRVMLVQPTLTPYGGGEGVCVWMLQALKDDHALSLMTWEAPDFAALNMFFGTSLRSNDVAVRLCHPWLPRALRVTPMARRLKHWALLGAARRHPGVDLLIAADEESDLGGRGIQYLHFPRLRGRGGLYERTIARLTGFSMERMRRNVTVVNSEWTGAEVRRRHAIDATTIHPPAVGPFPAVAWAERTNGFVAIGRLVPEKRFELIIELVAALRAAHPALDLTLDIVSGAGAPDCEARVAARARAAGPWVRLHRGISRAALIQLLAERRYGLHAMADEHYGMAVAEMVAAGLIPFVPRGGGQVEIVRDERLTWTSPADAFSKIAAVLAQPSLQAALGAALAARAPELGPERFMREIRTLVARTLEGRTGRTNAAA